MNGILPDHAARHRGGVGGDAIGVAPHRVARFAASARAERGVELPAERAAVARSVPAAVEGGVAPVVHGGAFAPPEQPLGVIHHAELRGQFDLAEQVVHARAGEQDRVGEIHGERGRGVVVDGHRRRDVIETGATRGGEGQQARHDVGGAGGNVGHSGFQAARRGPRNRRRGRGPVALSRDEDDHDLVHARRNAARRGRIGDGRAFARADLAHAVEIGVVELPRQVLAETGVAEGHVFAAEVRGRSQIQAGPDHAPRQQGKRSRRSFLVERTGRVEYEQALHEIRGDVGLQAVDLGQPAERCELRGQPGARAHSSREEINVAQTRRHPRRHVGWIEQRQPGAEGVQRKRRKGFEGHGESSG